MDGYDKMFCKGKNNCLGPLSSTEEGDVMGFSDRRVVVVVDLKAKIAREDTVLKH